MSESQTRDGRRIMKTNIHIVSKEVTWNTIRSHENCEVDPILISGD